MEELGGFRLHQIGLHWFTFHLQTVQSWVVVSGGQSYLALVRSEIKMVRVAVADRPRYAALPVLCGWSWQRSLAVLTVTITVLARGPREHVVLVVKGGRETPSLSVGLVPPHLVGRVSEADHSRLPSLQDVLQSSAKLIVEDPSLQSTI